MDISNLQAATSVGKDISKSTARKSRQTKIKAAKSQYKNWWLGLGISYIPLLAIPLYEAFNNSITLSGFLIMLFSSCEVVYMGVSLGITSLNDYVKHHNSKDGRIGWNIFLIVLGAVIYALMAISKYNSENFNDLLALSFNIIFMLIIIVLSSAEYIQQIREAK